MRTTPLGRTGLHVSRLCFGTGTTTFDRESAQSKQAPPELGATLLEAHRRGLTFWDTADNYATHAHVAWALARVPRASVAVTSKTHASTAAEAEESLARTLAELGTDYLDLMLLHEVDSPEALLEAAPALEALHRARAQGRIRAVGLSTHAILTLEAVAGERPDIQVILTNFNFANAHMDAHVSDYARAMAKAHAHGQGVVAMKTLGEGKIAHLRAEAIPYNLAQPFIDSVVVGMMDARELDDCLAIAESHFARETQEAVP